MMNENKQVIMNDRTVTLIRLLRQNGRMKKEELAKGLGCTERQVYRHKQLAELFGYKIESYSGNTNPGYELVEEKLNDAEKEYLRQQLDHSLFEKTLYQKIIRIMERV